ncbi:response regulator transcription factor [Saccharicrinis sp. FJH2]|uniref:response regulator transcription factor n=1 Tax=Saccharicrinis sp. FJH65 TaxID=3344659 RepID=UPI0035F3DC34
MSVLLIEDDVDLGKLLTQFLEMNDIEVVHARDGETALDLFERIEFDLAIIDVMLPDTNGFKIAKVFKQQKPDLPFLFLTAKNKKEDIISGLKLGAEDYITKPFEPEELVLRINIVLRRNLQNGNQTLDIGNSSLKHDELKLCTPQNEYKLTQKESELIAFIIKNKNRLIKRQIMLKTIWGENDYFLGRSMDVFISRLRKFFKDDPMIRIETFRGVGYIFRDN